jgi:predicted N-acetyltransferase YhbS
MSQAFQLSPTLPSDTAEIEELLDRSFGLSRRTKTSYRLREGNEAVASLSCVVREEGLGLVGTISYWPLVIGTAGTKAMLLGPIAVHPDRQQRGIGLFLMRETLALARSQGHALVLLVGDAPYYARVGFMRVPDGQMILPGPWEPARFLFLELQSGALSAAKGLVLPPQRALPFSPLAGETTP